MYMTLSYLLGAVLVLRSTSSRLYTFMSRYFLIDLLRSGIHATNLSVFFFLLICRLYIRIKLNKRCNVPWAICALVYQFFF